MFVGPASAAREPFRFLTTETTFESFPRFSPDGKWIAYTSNESGRAEVYVRPFSGAPAEPSGKLQVSNNGSEYAVWGPSRSGDLLHVQRWLDLRRQHTRPGTNRNPPHACAAVSDVRVI